MRRIAAMLKKAGWVLIGPDMFVLAAMVTPAVMILATSSLILTTTNRLVRVVDRVREMLPEFEALASSDSPDNPKMAMLFDDLHRATVRARGWPAGAGAALPRPRRLRGDEHRPGRL
jgi:hypothetical protein